MFDVSFQLHLEMVYLLGGSEELLQQHYSNCRMIIIKIYI